MTAAQQRRKASSKLFKALRRGWRKLKGVAPVQDSAYLAWLRTQPCAIPNCWSCAIEAAHVGAIRGLRQKCSDREAIALCAWHHRIGAMSHHRLSKKFWLFWDLDRDEVIAAHNRRYEDSIA